MENTGYLSISYNILALEELTLSAKILFAEIISLSKLEGYCYASNEYLAKRLRISATTVKSALQQLRKKNFITTKTLKFNERFIYPCPDKIRPPVRAKSDRPQGEKRPYPRSESVHNNKRDNIKDNNNYKYTTERDFYLPDEPSYDINELMKIK